MIAQIKQNTAKGWKYFLEYYNNDYEEKIETLNFEELPFEYQLGVFISFFNAVSTDVDLYSNEMVALQEAIVEAFNQYEEYLFLDS